MDYLQDEKDPGSPERRPRNDRRRDRNRQRLIDATLDIVLEQGTGALSMAGIAKRAGLHHSGFYAHFRNVEECVQAALRQVSEAQRARDVALRELPATKVPHPEQVDIELVEATFRGFLSQPRAWLLLLQCRHEQSAIGEVARDEVERGAAELTEYVWRIALHYGARAEHLRELEALARYMLDGVLAAGLELLQGRSKDVRAAAERLTRYNRALMAAELQRLLGPPSER